MAGPEDTYTPGYWPDDDARVRADSAGGPGRIFDGLIRAVGRLLALPVLLPRQLLLERRWDRSNGNRAATAIDPRAIPIVVVPLADFERRGVELPSGAAKRFVLLTSVVFTRSEAGLLDVKQKGFEGHLIPGQDDLRQISSGFVTDFASIPSLLSVVGHPAGRYARAAIVHDWAYSCHHDGSSKGRRNCDDAMLEMMRSDGVRAWRRAAIYLGLRLGGGLAYRRAPSARRANWRYEQAMQEPFAWSSATVVGYLLKQLELIGCFDVLGASYGRSSSELTHEITEAVDSRLKELLS